MTLSLILIGFALPVFGAQTVSQGFVYLPAERVPVFLAIEDNCRDVNYQIKSANIFNFTLINSAHSPTYKTQIGQSWTRIKLMKSIARKGAAVLTDKSVFFSSKELSV